RSPRLTEKNNQVGRRRLAASKLRLLQLGGWPDIREPLPPKPKWTRRRTYLRICNEIQALEAKAKTQRYSVASSRPKLRTNSVIRGPITSLTSRRWQTCRLS